MTLAHRLGLIAALGLAAAAHSGTIEVEVRERDGLPVADQTVWMFERDDAGNPRGYTRSGETDGNGRVRFSNLKPGSYTFILRYMTDPALVAPHENPFARMPVVTLADETDELEVTIELWRGSPLLLVAAVDRGDLPRGLTAMIANVETGRTREARLPLGGVYETSLPPGRWEVTLSVPPGYLIASLERNGEGLEGHVVRLDTSEDWRAQRVVWSLSASCVVEGHVRNHYAPVVATLLEPGPWFEQARLRGGTELSRVPAQRFDFPDRYELRLPEGLWRLTPEAPDLVSSDPDFADLRLVPGQTARQDFVVEREGGERDVDLVVRVRDPAGEPVVDAVVELYPAGAAGPDDEPIARKKTPRWRPARFSGLAAGDYLVFAGHGRGLPGKAEVRALAPEDEEEPRYVTLTLREGGAIRAHATDEENVPVADVRLEIRREDDLPPPPPREEALRRDKTRRSVDTDQTGYVETIGLHGGRHRLTAHLLGEQGRARFARVARSGAAEATPDLVLDVEEGRRHEIDLRVVDAASLHGTLSCDDGAPVPPVARFRVVPEGADEDDAVLDIERLPLGGRHLDSFRVGPLEAGAYQLVFRPEGMERWTWAYGTLERARSAIFTVPDGEPVLVGPLEARCRPALSIVPKILSQEAPPDLRDARVEATATRDADTGETLAAALRVLPLRDRVVLEVEAEGEIEIDGRWFHPYLVPPRMELATGPRDFERGARLTLNPVFERVGGRLRIRTDSPAVRVQRLAGEPRVARPSPEGRVDLPGLPPGSYAVAPCLDAGCGATEPAIETTLSPGHTTEIDLRGSEEAAHSAGPSRARHAATARALLAALANGS